MLRKLFLSSVISILALASEAPKETQKFANGSSVFDVVTHIKPLQALILGYLDDRHDLPKDQITEPEEICGVAYSRDGKHMATVSKNGEITIRDAHTHAVIKKFNAEFTKFQGGGGTLSSVSQIKYLFYTPQNYLVCSQVDVQFETKIWDAAKKYALIMKVPVEQLLFNKKGCCAGFKNKSGALCVDNKFVKQLEADFILSGVALPDDQIFLVGNYSCIEAYDTQTGNKQYVFTGGNFPVTYLAVSPDGAYVASGSLQSVRLWDAASRTHLKDIVAVGALEPRGSDNSNVHDVLFSHDGRYLIYLRGKTVTMYNMQHGTTQQIFVDKNHETEFCSYSPDGKYFAVVAGKTVHIFTTQAQELADVKNGDKATDCAHVNKKLKMK